MNKRIAEGGAILDGSGMTMERYSEEMKRHLGQEYGRFAEDALAELNLPVGAVVVEIGPGPGWAGIEVLRRKNDISLTAIEPSGDMRRVASKNADNEGFSAHVAYEEGFAENLERFGDRSVDAVISRDSLHHWVDPAIAFREIERILKPSGRLYIADCRRDLGLTERLLICFAGKRMAGPMLEGWRNSIRAGYTVRELERTIAMIGITDWRVRKSFFSLAIKKIPLA